MSRKEDALNTSKSNQSLSKTVVIVDPLQGPVSFLLNNGDGLDGVEQVLLLGGVLNVCVDQKRIGLRVDVLHCDLESVERSGLSDLDFVAELDAEIFVDDAIRGGEESQDVLDEILLLFGEVLPVVQIGGKVDLLGGPEGRLLFLVLLPDAGVLNRQDNKSSWVVGQDFFIFLELDLLLNVKFVGGHDYKLILFF